MVRTLVEAVLIVTLVVFVFLGSPRSVLIPIIAIPLSLIGTFTMMLVFGFSINLLTLLALVLAIGLVVDDAIIVVENVNRHLEDGMRPIPAAMQAAHELAGPIVAMTVVLIAVYVPIGFQGGLTGALFTEFAFTLVGAVTVSAIVALTLSPMMCSRLLRPHAPGARDWEARLVGFIDRRFGALHRGYQRWLPGSLNYLPVTAIFAADHSRQHLFLLHRREHRAGTAGRPGRDHHRRHLGAECHAGSSACCTTGRSIRISPASRKPPTSSSSTCPGRTSPAWC